MYENGRLLNIKNLLYPCPHFGHMQQSSYFTFLSQTQLRQWPSLMALFFHFLSPRLPLCVRDRRWTGENKASLFHWCSEAGLVQPLATNLGITSVTSGLH